MKRKKKQDVSRRTRKIIRAVTQEEKKVFKVWTVETLTAILAVIGFLTLFLNTWQQVDIVPQIQEHSTQVDEFQKSRLAAFEDIRQKWTYMRVILAPYITECTKKNPSPEILKKYKEESKKNVDTTRDASAGILDYYWGTSIHKIFRYEINFYYNYIISCPKGDSQTINAALHDREDKLMQLLLTKSYDPREENKFYDNPYYANF